MTPAKIKMIQNDLWTQKSNSKNIICASNVSNFIYAVTDPGFSWGGGTNSEFGVILLIFFSENCVKMKGFGPRGGHVSLALQGLFVPFAHVGSGDPVRVLRLFHNKYTGFNWSIYCWDYVQLVATDASVLLVQVRWLWDFLLRWLLVQLSDPEPLCYWASYCTVQCLK